MYDPQEKREDPRTLWEVTMDIKYAVAAHGLAEAHFVKTNKFLVFLQAFFTSCVVWGAAKQSVELSLAVGILLAFVSAYQQSSKPLAEAAKHSAAREKFSALLAKAVKGNTELEALDSEYATLGAKAPHIPRAIQFAAFNDNLMTNGRPDGMVKEGWSVKLIRVFS